MRNRHPRENQTGITQRTPARGKTQGFPINHALAFTFWRRARSNDVPKLKKSDWYSQHSRTTTRQRYTKITFDLDRFKRLQSSCVTLCDFNNRDEWKYQFFQTPLQRPSVRKMAVKIARGSQFCNYRGNKVPCGLVLGAIYDKYIWYMIQGFNVCRSFRKKDLC